MEKKNRFVILAFIMASIAIFLEGFRINDVDQCMSWMIADLPSCLFFSLYLLVFLPIGIIGIFLQRNTPLFIQWMHFTYIYLSSYLLIYLIVPTQGAFLQPIYKENVAFVSLILYPILSIIVILIAKRKHKKSS